MVGASNMGCGGCGGSVKSVSRVRDLNPPMQTTRPIPIRPMGTKRILSQPSRVTQTVTVKAIKRAKDLQLCPLCNTPLQIILSGSGPRNRKRCSRCNRVFV